MFTNTQVHLPPYIKLTPVSLGLYSWKFGVSRPVSGRESPHRVLQRARALGTAAFHPLYNHLALARGSPSPCLGCRKFQGTFQSVCPLENNPAIFWEQARPWQESVPRGNTEGELATATPEHPVQMGPTEAAINGWACVEQRSPPGH